MSMKIIYKNCTGCRSCYDQCPADAIGWDKEKRIPYMAYPDECNHCGVCWMECKFNAIKPILPPLSWLEINRRYITPIPEPSEFKWPGSGLI
ncbi:MAG: ferredoxin family protein [Atribacterota bacterium]